MDLRSELLETILIIPALLIAFTFHEYAHARTAVALGDETPRIQGRLTLNPLAHVDIFGFIMILIFKFGWAKPVETNPRAFKRFYKDDLKVSIAGPLANLLIGFVFTLLLGVCVRFFYSSSTLYSIVSSIILYTAMLNCNWFFLNLLPIPGFDGFHIIRDLFPKAFYKHAQNLYTYQMIIFIVLVLPIINGQSILSIVVGGPGNYIFQRFLELADKIFF